MIASRRCRPRPELALDLILSLAALKLGLHLVTILITPYEFHRDEFLYFAMGDHLSLFRMDSPPAIALLAELIRGLLGDSLLAIRLGPAVFSTATVVLTALIARELGGRRFAQGLAAVCVIANPLFLRSGVLFQPVVLDQFAWTLGFYALARLARTDELRWWVVLGVATGFGLLAKYTIAVFGVAVIAALLITRGVSWLRIRGPWLAFLLAVIIGSPSIIGQFALDFPVLSYMADLREAQLARLTAADFVLGQLSFGPASLLAAAGAVFLLVDRRMKPFRVLGWGAVLAFALFVLLSAKDYYLGPVYPLAYAAGALLVEQWSRPRVATVVRWAVLGLVVLFGILVLPLGLPILKPPVMAAYAARIGGEAAVTTNVGAVEALPQDYADMLGWQDLVDAVSQVYHALPPEDRAQAVVIASNYGEAGAIDFYGPRYGVPRAIAFVGTYWHYGPGDKPGNVTIAVGFGRESVARRFATVDSAMTVGHPYGVEEQRDQTIYVGRGPHRTFQELWPEWEGRN